MLQGCLENERPVEIEAGDNDDVQMEADNVFTSAAESSEPNVFYHFTRYPLKSVFKFFSRSYTVSGVSRICVTTYYSRGMELLAHDVTHGTLCTHSFRVFIPLC